MTVYLSLRPPRRPDALTALMVPVDSAGRARVPLARPAATTTPLDLDVAALALGHLGHWTWRDLLLVPVALLLGEEPGFHRHHTGPGRRRYAPRHRHIPGDRPRPADGPSTRGMGRTRTPAAGWTHHHTTTTTGEAR